MATLIAVGAMKAGATNLYYYWGQYPDIFMSRVKEPHFLAIRMFKTKVRNDIKAFLKRVNLLGANHRRVIQNVIPNRVLRKEFMMPSLMSGLFML